METYNPNLEPPAYRSPAEPRRDRRIQLDWSAIFGGTALGWGVLLLLSVIGAAIGFAAIDPFSARPAANGDLASAVWGGVAMVVASVLGGFLVVRIAGDRRRSESLLHGAVSWGLSMLAGAVLAIFAASTAAVAAGPAAARRVNRPATTGERARLDDARAGAARAGGIAGGAAALALVGSLFGALLAASRRSGVPLRNEFQVPAWHHRGNGHAQHGLRGSSPARDDTTILPPTH